MVNHQSLHSCAVRPIIGMVLAAVFFTHCPGGVVMADQDSSDPLTPEAIEKLEKSPFGIGGFLIHSLAISVHDDFLACADWQGRLHIFETRTGKKILFLKPK